MHSFENLMKFIHLVSLKMHMNTEILNLGEGCQLMMYGKVFEVSIFLLNFYANICVYIHGEQLFYLSSKIYSLHCSVQSLSRVWLFVTPWIAACQASMSITNSWSSLRLTSIESVMPSSRLILGCPLLLLSTIPPSIRVFSNESTLHMRWPKYWSFSFSISPSKEIPGLISFRMDW